LVLPEWSGFLSRKPGGELNGNGKGKGSVLDQDGPPAWKQGSKEGRRKTGFMMCYDAMVDKDCLYIY
jgi:hypothetical protein